MNTTNSRHVRIYDDKMFLSTSDIIEEIPTLSSSLPSPAIRITAPPDKPNARYGDFHGFLVINKMNSKG